MIKPLAHPGTFFDRFLTPPGGFGLEAGAPVPPALDVPGAPLGLVVPRLPPEIGRLLVGLDSGLPGGLIPSLWLFGLGVCSIVRLLIYRRMRSFAIPIISSLIVSALPIIDIVLCVVTRSVISLMRSTLEPSRAPWTSEVLSAGTSVGAFWS